MDKMAVLVRDRSWRSCSGLFLSFHNERTSAPYRPIVRDRSFFVWQLDHPDRPLMACGQVQIEKKGRFTMFVSILLYDPEVGERI